MDFVVTYFLDPRIKEKGKKKKKLSEEKYIYIYIYQWEDDTGAPKQFPKIG